jgi:hypothetical protein
MPLRLKLSESSALDFQLFPALRKIGLNGGSGVDASFVFRTVIMKYFFLLFALGLLVGCGQNRVTDNATKDESDTRSLTTTGGTNIDSKTN